FPSNPLTSALSCGLARLPPTWYSAGPSMHLAVLEKAEQQPNARAMHSLRFVSTAGAAIPREVHDRMQSALGVPVLEHYGSSETAQIASNRSPPGPARLGT